MKKCTGFLLFLLITMTCFATPLPAQEVFQVQAKPLDPNTFQLHWTIKKGYFLYKDRINLDNLSETSIQIGTIIFPKATSKRDSQGNAMAVYANQLTLAVPVLGKQSGAASMQVQFQGCSETGFCYPPETKNITLQIDDQLALTEATIQTVTEKTQTLPEDTITSAFTQHHWIITTLIFYGFGLLLAFTPCVLPMVPVLSGLIVGHGKNITIRKAFFLSASYVLSMSITYALAGAAIALLGSNINIALQSPWIIGAFSLVFVLLSLSMFGVYELRLPYSWQNRISSITRSGSGGHYFSAALMGSLSTLILSPCVTAPLIGALGYIASSGNVFLGTLTLFALGLGMGTPLLLIGTSAGKLLPAAGHWMNGIRFIFGLLLLSVAIYLLERLLPGPVVMVLWAALLIFSGIYCGAFQRSITTMEKLGQGLGIMLLIYGACILVGASMGQENPLQPLATLPRSALLPVENNTTVRTVKDLQNALYAAKGKPVMVDFHADWCASCKIMQATILQDLYVRKLLKSFAIISVDLTDNTPDRDALLKTFQVIAPPTFLFYDAKGEAQPALTLVGEVSVNTFLKPLEKLSTDL